MSALAATPLPVGAETLAARAAMYQALSALCAGPLLARAGNDYWLNIIALLQAGIRQLPFRWTGTDLLQELQALTSEQQSRIGADYSLFFEASSGGIRFPIREELALNSGSMKSKEDLVRFYEFFGYALNPDVQWQPDHLAVELEFLSFLIESQWSESKPEQQQSFLFGQRDFIQRHLLNWLNLLTDKLSQEEPDHFYTGAISACHSFIQHDMDWLQAVLASLEDA